MTVNLNIVEKCVSCLNIKESYDLARRMEQEKTNPVLGYRTAGSLAERKTGDMLLEEMKKAGLTQVEKDKIRVDAWEFKKAVMRCHDREGTCREIQLGAYQTDFKTNGFQRFDLVYLGKGTADEYKDIDVKRQTGAHRYQPERRMVDQLPGVSGTPEGCSSSDRRTEQRIRTDR